MINTFSELFGCKFDDKLLLQALTHSSYAYENGVESYERLELLGDAVLSLCTIEMLYQIQPELSEGEMTKVESQMVCESTLATIAKDYDLGRYIRVGKGGEKDKVRDKPSVMADIIEALIAAAYLSSGINNARIFVTRIYKDRIQFEKNDYKTQLQEILIKKQLTPVYEPISEEGPVHDKIFTYRVIVEGDVYGLGIGGTKKEAQQKAAFTAIQKINAITSSKIELIKNKEIFAEKRFTDNNKINQTYKKLGIEYDKNDLLACAVIHRSFINENRELFNKYNVNAVLSILETFGKACIPTVLGDIGIDKHHYIKANEITLFMSKKALVGKEISKIFTMDDFYFGKSLVDASDSIKQVMVMQMIGAIAYYYDYNKVYEIILRHYDNAFSAENISPESQDFKTLLQEKVHSVNKTLPVYSIVNTIGPDHEHVFIARVITKDKKSATGEGTTKKRAEQIAAYNYLKTHMSNKDSDNGPHKDKVGPNTGKNAIYRIPAQNISPIRELCLKYELSNATKYSQALTHCSYLNENNHAIENGALAASGARYLDAVTIYKYINNVLNSYETDKIDSILPTIKINTKTMAKMYDVLGLESAVLVSKGQKHSGITEAMKGDFATAFIMTYFLNEKKSLKETLPVIDEYLKKYVDGISKNKDSQLDLKTYAQEVLQLIGVRPFYKTTNVDITNTHLNKYNSTLTLVSTHNGEEIIIKGTNQRSIADADKSVISMLIPILNEIYCNDINVDDISQGNNNNHKHIYEFIVKNVLIALPTEITNIMKWHNSKKFGINYFQNHNVYSFINWLKNIFRYIQSEQDNSKICDKIITYFKYTNFGKDENIEDVKYMIGQSIQVLSELNTDNPKNDDRTTKQFNDVYGLSKICRVMSQNYSLICLNDIIENMKYIKMHIAPILINNTCNDKVHIYEREGSIQLLLTEIINIINKDKMNQEGINIKIITDKSVKVIIERVSEVKELFQLIKSKLSKSIVWKIIDNEMGLRLSYENSLIVINTDINIELGTNECNPTITAIINNGILKRQYYDSISNYLHDIKNHLIAYNIAMKSIDPNDKSVTLKCKYDASRHLDSVLNIFKTIISIDKNVDKSEYVDTNLEELLRRFISDKISYIPLNIRIDTPRTVDPVILNTSPKILLNIFENIFKNSIEAMGDGGEIKIEWVYDSTDNLIYIEIGDTGPGIPKETLDMFNMQNRLDSSKETGSGIGMISIRNMINLLGGSYHLESSEGKGTRWLIILPVA